MDIIIVFQAHVFTIWSTQVSKQFLWWWLVSLQFSIDDGTWLILLIGSIGAVVAAIIALFTAWAAKKTAEETKKSVLAGLLMQIMDDYTSKNMVRIRKQLSNFKETYKNNFVDAFLKNKSGYIWDLRKYYHHFYKIHLLLDAGVVDESFVRKIAPYDGVKILLEIVEPLGKAGKEDYDKSVFETFRKMY